MPLRVGLTYTQMKLGRALRDYMWPFRSHRPIFVSFASDSDSENAELIVRVLESRGFRCMKQ